MKRKFNLQRRLVTVLAVCVLITFTAVFANEVARSRKAIEATTNNFEENVEEMFNAPSALVLPSANPPKPTDEPEVKDEVYIVPSKGNIMKGYSREELLYDKTMEDWRTHEGIDYAGKIGDSVYAVANGEIIDVGDNEMFGGYIIMKIGDIEARYYNLQNNFDVKKGDLVVKGQIIGGISNRALFEVNENPHLHFETWKDGKSFDLFAK